MSTHFGDIVTLQRGVFQGSVGNAESSSHENPDGFQYECFNVRHTKNGYVMILIVNEDRQIGMRAKSSKRFENVLTGFTVWVSGAMNILGSVV